MLGSRSRRTRLGVVAAATALFYIPSATAAPSDVIRTQTPGIPAAASSFTMPSSGSGQVSEKSGDFTYSYPIAVPPGRLEAAPTLSLEYSSSTAMHGGLAAGWQLSLPVIRRDRSRGLEYPDPGTGVTAWVGLTGTNLYHFAEPGVSNPQQYFRAWGDSSFARYRRVNDARWEVQTTDGTIQTFERRPGSPTASESFVLISSVDKFGNGVYYWWDTTTHATGLTSHELASVEYSRNDRASIESHARVTFVYGAPVLCGAARTPAGATLEPTSGGSYLRGARPLARIRTEVRDTPTSSYRTVREISLGYNSAPCSTRGAVRQLKTIQESARSPAGVWTTLPPVELEYGSLDALPTVQRAVDLTAGLPDYLRWPLSWGDVTSSGGLGSKDWSDEWGMLADFNGDGRQDRLVLGKHCRDVDNDGDLDECKLRSGCTATLYPGVSSGISRSATAVDLTGPAEWHTNLCTLSAQPAVAPHGHAPDNQPSVGNGQYTPLNIFRYRDMNGDGLLDIVAAIMLPQPGGPADADLPPEPNCDPNVSNPSWVVCNGPADDILPAVLPEGSADWFTQPRMGQFYDGRYVWRVYHNVGGNFSRTPTFVASPIPLDSVGGVGHPLDIHAETPYGLVDIDGDGYLDAVWAGTGLVGRWAVWRGNGGGFATVPYWWTAPTGVGTPSLRTTRSSDLTAGGLGTREDVQMTSLFDVNGDQLLDLVVREPQSGAARLLAYLNTGYDFMTTPEILQLTEGSAERTQSVDAASTVLRIFSHRIVDLNGDGVLDMIRLEGDHETIVEGRGTLKATFGVGPSFIGGVTHERAVGDEIGSGLFGRGGVVTNVVWYGYQVVGDILDMDGDGYPDVVGENLQYSLDPNAPPPGLLTRISGGGGGDGWQTIRYASRTDASVVVCDDGGLCRRGSAPRRVVAATEVGSAGRSSAAMTSYRYFNPVVNRDKAGVLGFRGFKTVEVTGPASTFERSITLNDTSYASDYRGVPSQSRTFLGGGQLVTIETSGFGRYTLGGDPNLEAYLYIGGQHISCVARTGTRDQQDAACRANDASLQTSQVYTALKVASDSLVTAYVPSRLTRTAPGRGGLPTEVRYTTKAHQLVSTDARYLVLDTEEASGAVVSGTDRQTAKTVTVYSATQPGLAEKIRVWIQGTEYADTVLGYASTGVLTYQQKPEQARILPGGTTAYTYEYSVFDLFPQHEVDEKGQEMWTFRDFATGAVVQTKGPQYKQGPSTRTYARTETDVDGFGRPLQTRRTEESGVMEIKIASTTTYANPAGQVASSETYTYQTLGDASSAIRTRREVDATGLVTREYRYGAGDIPAAETLYRYYPNGALSSVDKPSPAADGQRATYRWNRDGLGRETQAWRPDETGSSTTYSGTIMVRTETAPSGMPNPGPLASTTAEKNAFENLIRVQEQADEGARITTYEYDASDRVVKVTDPDSLVTELTYDGASRRTSITRSGRTWSYGFDRNGNLTTIVAPHDTTANPVAYTTSIVYDDLDRPLSRIAGNRDLTTAEIARFGNGSSSWTYDAAPFGIGKLAASTVSTGGTGTLTRRHTYDSTGNVIGDELAFSVWSGTFTDTRTISRTFDAANKVRKTTFADGATGRAASIADWQYDAVGRQVGARWVDDQGAVRRALGTAAWNQADHPRSIVAPSTQAVDQIIRYDSLGRVTSSSVSRLVWIGGILGHVRVPAATQTTQYFAGDDVRAMTSVVEGSNATHLEEWLFDYDRRHQLTGAWTSNNDLYESQFEYTPAGRLSSVFVDGPDGLDRDVVYRYGIGTGEDPATIARLEDSTSGAVTSFTWDRAGNQRTKVQGGTTTTYRYDGGDELREARVTGSGASREVYWYDAAGQRTLALTLDTAGNPTLLKAWLGETEIHYGASGAVQETRADVALAGASFARITNGARVDYTFHNQLGHLLAATDEAGALVAGFTYSPFGELIRTTGSNPDAFRRRFNDKESDVSTGLGYYGARYYDSDTLTWTQSDPKYRFEPESAWAEPRRANLYAFTLNNPLRYNDPDGRDVLSKLVRVIAWGRGKEGRKLNANELKALKPIYGDSVNYDKIRIVESTAGILGGEWLPDWSWVGSDLPFTVDNTIYMRGKSDLSTVIHEVGHVWQAQNEWRVFDGYAVNSVLSRIGGRITGRDAYDFDGDFRAGLPFSMWNPEAQAAFIEYLFDNNAIDVDPATGRGSVRSTFTYGGVRDAARRAQAILDEIQDRGW